MKKKVFMVILVVAIGAITSACIGDVLNQIFGHPYRSAELAPPRADDEANKMVVPTDKAVVYVYRLGQWTDAWWDTPRLYLDYKCVAGSLVPGGYYFWQLTPGGHMFETDDSKLIFNATGGEAYFIQYDHQMNLKLMDGETGRKHIESSRLLLIADVASECGPFRMSPEYRMKFKNITPSEGKALVYLYRNEDAFEYHDAIVYLDDMPPVGIVAGTHLFWQLMPGPHLVESIGGKVTLDAKAGETYYIRLEIMHRWWGGWYYPLILVDKEEGRKDVEESLLITETPAQ